MRGDADALRNLDVLLTRVNGAVRPLPSLVPNNAAEERARLVRTLEAGQMPVPAFRDQSQRVDPDVYRTLDAARALAERLPAGQLYLEKFEELELDLAILDAWGESRRIRPLSSRRYGTGEELVQTADGQTRLLDVAQALLHAVDDPACEPAVLPPQAPPGEPSVAAMILRAALGASLDVEVRVEPRLASLAATGERTVFLAQRNFGVHEARRLVAHEVFGHLIVAANARAQSLRLLEIGLAGSFADQEGVALYIEEALGLLCGRRLRTLAARVLATHRLHQGASFGETARELRTEHGFVAEAAIAVAERAYRGGGLARDAGYLAGWLRVRACVQSGRATLDELRRGRVAVAHTEALRTLQKAGWVRAAPYRPSLSLSRRLTLSGTSADTSPPSVAASLTMFELR